MISCSPSVLDANEARSVHPRPSNRGCTKYIPRFLTQGVDTLKETFDVVFSLAQWERLEDAKREAVEADPRGRGLVPVDLGGETLQVASHGQRGSVFLLQNDDMDVVVRGRDLEWSVSIEYRSAALWEHGVERMRERGRAVCAALGRPRTADCERLSAVHWAMDFCSAEFTEDMTAAIYGAWVCLSKVKKSAHGKIDLEMHGAGSRVETMTVGTKASLQVQIYDKGREIRENSGKTWMADIYAAHGNNCDDLSDIWRVELRFAKGFLKLRNIRTFEDFEENRTALLREALETRRLASPSDDSNRSRWPMHPLWEACLERAGEPVEFVPVDRIVTGKRAELLDRAEAGIAGYLLAAMVLDVGTYDAETLEELALRCVGRAISDRELDRKVNLKMERYRFVNDPC